MVESVLRWHLRVGHKPDAGVLSNLIFDIILHHVFEVLGVEGFELSV